MQKIVLQTGRSLQNYSLHDFSGFFTFGMQNICCTTPVFRLLHTYRVQPNFRMVRCQQADCASRCESVEALAGSLQAFGNPIDRHEDQFEQFVLAQLIGADAGCYGRILLGRGF
jgi:hypothetical protein